MTKWCLSPRHQQDDQLIPGHFFFGNALDHHLEPAGGPPMRIDGLRHLSLLTNIHLVIRLPAGASPGGVYPLWDQFSMAAPILPNYMADRHVQGLEVILPRVFIIEGGPCHFPAGAAGPGIGWNIGS